MLLVIDIGNSNIVLGVFEKENLNHSWRVATQKDRTADEYGVLCRHLFELSSISSESIDGIAICSVVPPVNERLEEMARKYFDLEPFFVEPASQNLIAIHYNPPSDVGADRIVNAVAAYQMFGGPAIVLDFGTATTFDAISKKGEYLGGIIAPGVGISAEALFARTAKLPRVEFKRPPRIIGNSTVTSVQAGIYLGYVSLVEGVLRRMKVELPDARVTVTGGLARLISQDLSGIDSVEEHLTLYGLKIFYEHHRSA